MEQKKKLTPEELKRVRGMCLTIVEQRPTESLNAVAQVADPNEDGPLADYIQALGARVLEADRLKKMKAYIALGLLDAGHYGRCAACDQEIPDKRLHCETAKPVIFCLGCQGRLEQYDLPGFEDLMPSQFSRSSFLQ